MPDKRRGANLPVTREPVPEDFEQLYGIRFSDAERELLTGAVGWRFTPIDRQKATLLRRALRPRKCPACFYILCERSAHGEFDWNAVTSDDDYACPHCKTRLHFNQTIVDGQEFFTIQPGQTVIIGQGLAPPALDLDKRQQEIDAAVEGKP
jgi:hypothetical protein